MLTVMQTNEKRDTDVPLLKHTFSMCLCVWTRIKVNQDSSVEQQQQQQLTSGMDDFIIMIITVTAEYLDATHMQPQPDTGRKVFKVPR